MRTYSFKVVIEPDEDAEGNPAWFADCPALRSIGAATSGRTSGEALKNINDVLHLIVQELVEEGKPLPLRWQRHDDLQTARLSLGFGHGSKVAEGDHQRHAFGWAWIEPERYIKLARVVG